MHRKKLCVYCVGPGGARWKCSHRCLRAAIRDFSTADGGNGKLLALPAAAAALLAFDYFSLEIWCMFAVCVCVERHQRVKFEAHTHTRHDIQFQVHSARFVSLPRRAHANIYTLLAACKCMHLVCKRINLVCHTIHMRACVCMTGQIRDAKHFASANIR